MTDSTSQIGVTAKNIHAYGITDSIYSTGFCAVVIVYSVATKYTLKA